MYCSVLYLLRRVSSVLLSYFSYFLAFCPTFVLLFGILSYFPTFLTFCSTLFPKLPNSILNFKNSPAAGLSLFLYSILLINCCSCQIFILYSSENITEWMSIRVHSEPWKPWKWSSTMKTMKTEICGRQNSQKNSPAASKIVNIFHVQNMKFIIKIWRRQSSIWTKNSLECVQKTWKSWILGKNNHENHEKLLNNAWEPWWAWKWWGFNPVTPTT